jgi:hypothetical protein
MQDRSTPARRIFLLCTAGPYIGSKADIAECETNVRFTPKSGHSYADAATLFLFSPDDHCPIDSTAILCMCDADPPRPVQQEIGTMHSRIGPLL